MKTKRLIVFFVVFGVVVFGIAAYFLSRPHEPVFITPQEFAQVPEQPKLIAEFTANYHLTDATDLMTPEGVRSDTKNRVIYSVAFSPVDASLIASINRNGFINLWDRDGTEAPVRVLSHPEIFPSIGFSPNGKLLASARWKVILWDVATGKKINTIETSFNQFAFSPDSKQLATIPVVAKYFRETGVKIWNIQDPKRITEVTTLPFNQSACAVDISSDGKWIAAGYINGTVNVWDLQTKQLVKTLETPLYQMDYLKFSPNNAYMVISGRSKQMYIHHGERLYRYIMWELPSWERKGEVLRGHVENLTFSPDGKLCASANHIRPLSGCGVQLWDSGSGAPITSIRRGSRFASNPSLFYYLETRDVAFSQDGHLVATGSEDGIIRVWELTPQQLEGTTIPADVVRILYLLPKDKTPPPDIINRIDKTIKAVQDLYADEMERHGFGRKTFTYETDENGTAQVYLIRENQTEIPDLSKDIWLAVRDDSSEIPFNAYQLQHANANGRFRFPSMNGVTGNVSRYDTIGFTHGKLVQASTKNIKRKRLAYTLRGAFGLPYAHLQYERNAFQRLNNIMPWAKKWHKLTKCEAEWLDKSRFFNPNQPFFDKRPTIEMTVSNAEDSDTRLFTFSVTDEDGIHQVQLFVPIDMKYRGWRKKFYDCKPLKGKEEATLAFEITDPEIMTVELRMIDMHGNIAHREFFIKPKTDELTKEP